MINIDELDIETLVGGFAGVLIVLMASIWYLYRKEVERKEEVLSMPSAEESAEESDEQIAGETAREKGKSKKNYPDFKKKDTSYAHQWSLATLKGHSTAVTDIDFSSDGKRLISVSVDRNALIWKCAEFTAKEHKTVRQVLDFDAASKVAIAPDSKSVICCLKRENKLGVYKMVRKDDTGALKLVRAETVDFPQCHKLDISAIGIASTGKFLMTASPDMKIVLYNLKGEVLTTLEPKVSSLFDCSISPDGRFVAIAGFTPDVFVYEPKFSREGEFQSCKKVFILAGHNSGVFSVAFNHDSSRAVTVSRDGFWRVFDTDIRYAQGQDSKELRRGEWSELRSSTPDRIRMAVSPSGGAIAISAGTAIRVFSAEDETKEYKELPNVHASSIERLLFSPCGRWLASCGDKYIRIFHNVPEHHSQLIKLQRTLPEVTTDAARRRIQDQIEEAKKKVTEFEMEA